MVAAIMATKVTTAPVALAGAVFVTTVAHMADALVSVSAAVEAVVTAMGVDLVAVPAKDTATVLPMAVVATVAT